MGPAAAREDWLQASRGCSRQKARGHDAREAAVRSALRQDLTGWQLKPPWRKAFARERLLDVPAGTWAGPSRLMGCTAEHSGVRRPPWEVPPSRRPIVQRPHADCEDDPEPGTRTSRKKGLAQGAAIRRHHHSPVRLEQAALNDQGIEFALIFTRENHHWQGTCI